MNYFLIAGEPSGDLHAANLMAEIKKNDPKANFQFFGGDLMQAQGGKLLKHYREMAFMGILPVIMNLRKIKKNFKECEEQLLAFHPDVLILIDYPGFNLRMAKFAKLHQIPTSYYISPKLWAWKTKRIKKVKAYVDQMYTILPFETEFYKSHNYPVTYVGNPVWDLIQNELKKPVDRNQFCTLNKLSEKPIIALLAGSRVHEIKSLLQVMEEVSVQFPNYQFVIAGAPGNTPELYQSILQKELTVVFDQTYTLLRNSEAAIVASGTATLETALLNIPQVVIYKMGLGWILEKFRDQILKTDFFSLVNLVAEKEIVKELLQSEVTTSKISSELHEILENESYRLSILKGYFDIREKINSDGAAVKAALAITKSIQ
jgi:lipid-A-disaccharide synthase